MSGQLFIVAAPSGAGKTTLVKRLLAIDPVRLSISHTTRSPRVGEDNGVAYHFITVDQFKAKMNDGEFLEWAEVHGNYYGTSKSWIATELSAGRDVLLEIDWQGAAQVRQAFPAAVGVFILPPSMEELTRRLTGRGTDSQTVISARLAAAQDEMRHVGEFDYVIINDDLELALTDLAVVVRAARLKFLAQKHRHAELFSHLL